MQQLIRKYYDDNGMDITDEVIQSNEINQAKLEDACLRLELPETGVEWLDKLIAKKQRQSIAEKAMNGMLANQEILNLGTPDTLIDIITTASTEHSDALIAELNKK